MTDEPMRVCPRCDHRDIYPRRPSIQGHEHDHAFRCEECGHRFDEPRRRQRRSSVPDADAHRESSARCSDLVADLLDANPDEVGP